MRVPRTSQQQPSKLLRTAVPPKVPRPYGHTRAPWHLLHAYGSPTARPPHLCVHVWPVLLQEPHKVLVLEQHVLLDDADVGLGLAQAGELALQELTHLVRGGGDGGIQTGNKGL